MNNRTEKILRQVEKSMAAFNAVMPKPKSKSIVNSIWKNYIWFSKKDGVGYCTKCGGEFAPTKSFRHNTEIECPVCHKKAFGRDTHRKNREDIHWVVVPHMNGDNLMTRRYRVVVDWTDFRNPSVDVQELFRDTHEGEKWTGYMWWRTNDDRMMWMPYKEWRGAYMNAYTGNFYTPHSETIYQPKKFAKELANSKYRYFPVTELMPAGDAWSIDNMIHTAETKPWIELLYKVGFTSLCKSSLSFYNAPSFNVKATNVVDLLGVPHRTFKLMLSIGDPTAKQLKLLRQFPADNAEDLALAEYMDSKMYGGGEKAWELLQSKAGRKKLHYIRDTGTNPRDYFDYIGWLDKLGYNADDDYYALPKDFVQAHDLMSAAYKKYQDRMAMKQKRMQDKAIAKLKEQNDLPAFHLHHNGLFVAVAGSVEELRREGATLHHCVATYAERVARGETTILFIRREEEPDKPFYTMELKDGIVQQLRGYANCEPTGEVLRFRDAFIAELSNCTKAA